MPATANRLVVGQGVGQGVTRTARRLLSGTAYVVPGEARELPDPMQDRAQVPAENWRTHTR